MPSKYSGTIKQWWCWPFVTKPPSVRKYMRHTEAHACKFCGSVAIIGGDRLRIGKKRAIEIGEHRHFCDLECAGEYKKIHNHTYQYHSRYAATASSPGGKYELQEFRDYIAKHVAVKRKLLHAGWWVCIECGKATNNCNRKSRAVCLGCYYKEQDLKLQALRDAKRRPIVSLSIDCGSCGERFKTNNLHKMYCSPKCAKKVSRSNGKHRRRARIVSGPHETIRLNKLRKIHNNTCVTCRCRCNRKNNDPLEGTIDHIIPLSKGGLHTWSNVQLLCRECNSKKSDRIQDGTQLMLQFD